MSIDGFNVERDLEGPLEAVRPKTEMAADLLTETQGPEVGLVIRELAKVPPQPRELLERVEGLDPEARRDAIAWLWRYAEECADTGHEEAAEAIMVSVVEPLATLYDVRPSDFLDDAA